VSHRLTQVQLGCKLDMTFSFNRMLLVGQYLEDLLRKLSGTMNKDCHALDCLLVMVLSLQARAPCLSTAALWLRPTTMASILRYLSYSPLGMHPRPGPFQATKHIRIDEPYIFHSSLPLCPTERRSPRTTRLSQYPILLLHPLHHL
jgi:hypothetical protein